MYLFLLNFGCKRIASLVKIGNIILMYLYLKIALLEYTERILESNDWATFLLVGCFLLLSASKYFFPQRFEEFIQLPLSDRYLSVRGKDDAVSHPFNVMLFVIQLVCVSIFIFLLIESFNPTVVERNQWLFVQILTGYSVFVLVKFLVEKIIAAILSIDAIIDHYLYHKLSHRNFLALLIFLGNLFFIYIVSPNQNILLLFGFAILFLNAIALFYSYKKYRNLIASNFFHFILYLCALEIAPYIILYKVIFIGDDI